MPDIAAYVSVCLCLRVNVSVRMRGHVHARVCVVFVTVQRCPKGFFPFSHYKC